MNSRFWTFLTAEAVNTLGDAFGLIGVGWMVYTLTGSKLAMGTLLTVGLVPELVMRLIGAPLIDRVHRVRLMALLDAVQCAAYTLPVLLELSGHLSLWHLYAVSVVAGTAKALYIPAFMSLMPNLVDRSTLPRANALSGGVLQVASLAGPGLAGLLIMRSGSRLALAVNAVSFGVCAVLLLILSRRVGGPQPARSGGGGYFHQLAQGFRFFGQVRVLLVLLVALTFCNAGFLAVQAMQIPYVSEVLGGGANEAGFLASAYPLGYVIGFGIVGPVSRWVPRRVIMLGTLTAWGVLEAGLGLLGPGQLPAAMALYGLVGLTNALFITHSDVIYQTVVPDHLRGRVLSVRVLVAWSGRPVGTMAGALLAQSIGLRGMFLIAGLVPAVAALITFFIPLMHQLDGELAPKIETA